MMMPPFYQIFLLISLIPIVQLLEVAESQGDTIDCSRSKIDHNVTLAEGRQAGSFLKAKSVSTMEECLRHCCQLKGCDVAFLTNNECYSVKCKSLDTCAPTMNTDKRMSVAISYVARPKASLLPAARDSNVELEVTDNFIAEPAQESAFAIDDRSDSDVNFQQQNQQGKHETWRDTKDAAIAITCGFVAVVVGVAGVIVMTRQLVEDEGTYPYTTSGKFISDLKLNLPKMKNDVESNIDGTCSDSGGNKQRSTSKTEMGVNENEESNNPDIVLEEECNDSHPIDVP